MKGLRLALILLFLTITPASPVLAQDWNLVLQFTSDIQGQLSPFDVETVHDGEVLTEEVGGMSRLSWAMHQVQERFPGMSLTLSGGDDLLGPYAFFSEGVPIYEVMNRLPYDAGTLGNHEFDRGDAFLAEALANRDFPVVVANLVTDPESPLSGLVHSSMVLERNGLRIGVFGLVNNDLALISNPGEHVAVTADYAEVSHRMVAELEAQDTDLIVAMVHIGQLEARELAAQVPSIDVICVGDDVTLVERGRELVEHPGGGSTIVVQSGYRGEYLGLLKLSVVDGKVAAYHWQPIRLDESVPKDTDICDLLSQCRKGALDEDIVARTLSPLDLRKRSLRTGESPFAGLVAETLRQRMGTDVAILNSGTFRGDQIIPAGPLTDADLETIFPFDDTIYVLEAPGSVLIQALERGVSDLPEANGCFLQVSGLRYAVDLSQQAQALVLNSEGRATGIASPGHRIAGVEVMGPGGEYEPLDPARVYTVTTNAFVAEGGDGYIMLQNLAQRENTGVDLKLAVREGLAAMGEFDPQAMGRILVQGP